MKASIILFIVLTIGLFSCEKDEDIAPPPNPNDSLYFGHDTFTVDFLFLDRFNHTPIKGMYSSVFKYKLGTSYENFTPQPLMRMYSDSNGRMYGKVPVDSTYRYSMYFSHDRGGYLINDWMTLSSLGGTPPTYTLYPYPLTGVRLRFIDYQQVDSVRVEIRQQRPYIKLSYTEFESGRFNRPGNIYHNLSQIGFNDAYITYRFKRNGIWEPFTPVDTVYIPPYDTIIYDLHL